MLKQYCLKHAFFVVTMLSSLLQIRMLLWGMMLVATAEHPPIHQDSLMTWQTIAEGRGILQDRHSDGSGKIPFWLCMCASFSAVSLLGARSDETPFFLCAKFVRDRYSDGYGRGTFFDFGTR